jgi:hypothetical protein
MTNNRREEMRHDRHSAAFKEKRMRARQRKHLMAVASSIVENADAPVRNLLFTSQNSSMLTMI